MFESQGGLRVMHWHGGNDWVPMSEGSGHDVSSHDPERAWLKGARIFRCSQCEEEIAIAPDNPRDDAEADHPHPVI
jgi:hypothetical protein